MPLIGAMSLIRGFFMMHLMGCKRRVMVRLASVVTCPSIGAGCSIGETNAISRYHRISL